MARKTIKDRYEIVISQTSIENILDSNREDGPKEIKSEVTREIYAQTVVGSINLPGIIDAINSPKK